LGLILSAALALLFFFLACQRFFLNTGRIHTLDRRRNSLRPAPSKALDSGQGTAAPHARPDF
jgi:hypothetical protein